MTKAVPFLTREEIEDAAVNLLHDYGSRYEVVSKPPIPADEILNTHLKLALDFDDLPRLLDVDADVFGATWLDKRQVIIDERLDPTNHPEMIGRYNFTVGHETGHWQLHRSYFEKNTDQQQLFMEDQSPSVVCRTSQSKERIEWQADFFSSCLLMPPMMLRDWCKTNYRFERITLNEIKARTASHWQSALMSDDQVIEKFTKSLAKDFAVSPIAMRIRLETLGLIVRNEVPRLFALENT